MARSVSRRALAAHTDSDDDELPPPSALLNKLATPAKPRWETPRRRSGARETLLRRIPRLSGPKGTRAVEPRPSQAVGPVTKEDAPVRRSPRTPARREGQAIETPTSAERHRQLADELFPPSPPANVTPPVMDSPDIVEDSEEEETMVKGKAGTTINRAARPEDDEGDLLATRLEMLGLSSPPHPARTARPISPSVIPDSVASTSSSPTSSLPSARRSISSSTVSQSRKPVASPLPQHLSRSKAHETETVVVQDSQEDDEVVLACTDDEEEEELSGTGARRKPDRWTEDVTETDGILIYEPTPKKRPVKLSSRRISPSPFLKPAKSPAPSSRPAATLTPASKEHGSNRAATESPAKDAGARKSNLRVEIDLTGESEEDDEDGEDDDLLPPPPPRRQPTSPASVRPPSSFTPHTPTVRPKAPRLPSQPLPPRTPSSNSAVPRLTNKDRQTLPLLLIRELDKSVFRKRWDGLRCLDKKGEEGRGKGLPEGIEVVWSKRLLKTAGRATWKRCRLTTMPGSPDKTTTLQALVELSTKVTDTETKLKDTLAHELCHLAAWAIDGEMKPPHGPSFKTWAKRVMLVRPDIEVTTTHSYEIVYKYRWQCARATCGKIFSRHSNSINPSTHGCPCGSRIVPIDKDGNVKAGHGFVSPIGGTGGTETPKTERKKSKWVEFLQAQSPLIRRDHPSLPQSAVFKLAAERWRAVKAASQDASVPITPSKKSGRTAAVALEVNPGEDDEDALGDTLERLKL